MAEWRERGTGGWEWRSAPGEDYATPVWREEREQQLAAAEWWRQMIDRCVENARCVMTQLIKTAPSFSLRCRVKRTLSDASVHTRGHSPPHILFSALVASK